MIIKDLFRDVFGRGQEFGIRLLAWFVLCAFAASLVVGFHFGVFIVKLGQSVTTRVFPTEVIAKQVIPAYETKVGSFKMHKKVLHPQSYQLSYRIKEVDYKSTVEKEVYDAVAVGGKIQVFCKVKGDRPYRPIKVEVMVSQ